MKCGLCNIFLQCRYFHTRLNRIKESILLLKCQSLNFQHSSIFLVTLVILGLFNFYESSNCEEKKLRYSCKWKKVKTVITIGCKNGLFLQGNDNIDWTTYWNPKVFLSNAIAQKDHATWFVLQSDETGETYIVEKNRMVATFTESMELALFPFDIQVSLITK